MRSPVAALSAMIFILLLDDRCGDEHHAADDDRRRLKLAVIPVCTIATGVSRDTVLTSTCESGE